MMSCYKLTLMALCYILKIRYIFSNNYVIEPKEFVEMSILIEKNTKTIPNYLFRTCESNIRELPYEFHRILNETHKENDDYIQIYFSNYERKLFVKTFHSLYYELYLSLVPGAYQADLFRLLILYSFGGLYADISVQFLKKINSFINSTDEFISVKEINNWGIQQTFIAAYPKHPLILKMIELVTANIRGKDYGTNTLDITGPYAIFRAYNHFFGYPDEQPIQGGINIIKNYRVKFLYHIIDKENKNFITMEPDNIDSRVMKKKFPGYKQLIYQNQSIHYTILWKQRSVFVKNNATSNIM